MTEFEKLPKVQKYVLLTLYSLPDLTSTPRELIERIPFPDQVVDMTMLQLERAGHIRQVHKEGETVRLQLSEKMIFLLTAMQFRQEAIDRNIAGF